MSKDPKPGNAPDPQPPGSKPPAPPSPPAPGSPSAAAEKKTPAEWALKHGHAKPRNPAIPQSTDHIDPAYAVARELYGWKKHEHDFQPPNPPFLITERTYRDALAAAPQHPAIALVQAALTPAAAERHKNFEPARNLKVERAAKAAEASNKEQR